MQNITDSSCSSFLKDNNIQTEDDYVLSFDNIWYYDYKYKTTKCSDNRYIITKGTSINFRYEVIKDLGKGVFSNVYMTNDHKRNKCVALKIIRAEKRFFDEARKEIKILKDLNHPNVIRIYSIFYYFDTFGYTSPIYRCDLLKLIRNGTK